MLNLVALLALAYFLFVLYRLFRRTLPAVEAPRYVLEKPPLPRDLAAVQARADRWREEGRLSREEHEKLQHLIGEDASKTDSGKRKR